MKQAKKKHEKNCRATKNVENKIETENIVASYAKQANNLISSWRIVFKQKPIHRQLPHWDKQHFELTATAQQNIKTLTELARPRAIINVTQNYWVKQENLQCIQKSFFFRCWIVLFIFVLFRAYAISFNECHICIYTCTTNTLTMAMNNNKNNNQHEICYVTWMLCKTLNSGKVSGEFVCAFFLLLLLGNQTFALKSMIIGGYTATIKYKPNTNHLSMNEESKPNM